MWKPCKDCGTDTEYKLRRATRCNRCRAARYREYTHRTQYHKRRYATIVEHERERHLIRKYGVTLADYDRMFYEQGGACAICRRTQARALDVDHDHGTGEVRGLLCTNCNRMVGHAGDDPTTLAAGADYIRSSRKSQRPS